MRCVVCECELECDLECELECPDGPEWRLAMARSVEAAEASAESEHEESCELWS